MIRENKWKLLISSIIILLPVAFGLWIPALFILLGHWVCVLFTSLDPKNKGQNKKVFGVVIWITPLVSLFASGMTYAFSSGKDFEPYLVTNLLMGAMFVVIGNYLPKCKQNYTIGIKVKWTLQNEENWDATHRFGGRVWVIGGAMLMLSVFLPEAASSVWMLVAIAVLVLVPTVYSYRYYKKQMAEGAAEFTPLSKNTMSKPVKWLSGLGLVSVLIFTAVTMFTGDISVAYQEESFTIEANFWSDKTVAYDEIDGIEYRDKDDRGARVGGFGSARLLMGAFRNDEFGNYTRYSYTKCDACVVMNLDEKILVVSGPDAESTKTIYEKIKMNME